MILDNARCTRSQEDDTDLEDGSRPPSRCGEHQVDAASTPRPDPEPSCAASSALRHDKILIVGPRPGREGADGVHHFSVRDLVNSNMCWCSTTSRGEVYGQVFERPGRQVDAARSSRTARRKAFPLASPPGSTVTPVLLRTIRRRETALKPWRPRDGEGAGPAAACFRGHGNSPRGRPVSRAQRAA